MPLPLRRPKATTGVWSWITTVDHKKIGIMYGALALVFFVVAGLEALLIRVQLFGPNGTVLTASQYNQVFTMHGTTMVFLVGMPMAVAFGNYLVPLQIGARDVAFPRINAFGFWIVLLGGVFIYSSFFLGGAPDGGWFGYTPLTSSPMSSGFLPGRGPDFWAIGLIFLGIGSTTSAVNFIVTILNMRAPGMTMMRMPVFVWMIFVIAFLTLFAMPIITVALIMVYTDRHFATNFFFAPKGGDPLLYQHLFWLFGHPEVYILILPGMGIVSEVLPVFARKPLFGRAVVIFSGIAIGFLGWSVWAHHMFTTGLGPVAVSAFSLATMLIAIPTGVKIFNWLGTVFKGSIRLTTAMLFSLGFIVMFTIGGVSGVLHSVVPGDTQQTDTYFVVAHFHYVLFGGLILAIFSGFYFWFPKFFGRMLNERMGKINFWTMLIGFNLTFFPMHLLGLYGQPRRTYRYDTGMGWTGLNQIVSIGSFLVAFSVLIFLVNVIFSLVAKRGAVAGNDPWDARTLEWSVSSPPPAYNFAEIPQVAGPDGFWDQKYTEDDQGRLLAIPSGGSTSAKPESDGSGIHLPSPSIYPLVVAIGIMPIAYGAVFENLIMVGAGVLVMLFGMYAWAIEPSTEEH
ncbi:MAG: cytochrome c oxidase subunit I [Actinobacteria bacterium]|nr:cytochrome c oxidase subunit I [Acidimicrobiia bacterium]PHX59595.1 MAG: cytochrome c oxidase subunit I [Actinomycetota bacterium]